MQMEEIWKQVPFAPNHEASSLGRIRLKPDLVKRKDNAPSFGWWDKKKRRFQFCAQGKTLKVHQMVCAAFHGPKPFPAAVAMHGDENSANNRPDNLSWGTQKENLNAPGFLKHCSDRCREMNKRRGRDRITSNPAAPPVAVS